MPPDKNRDNRSEKLRSALRDNLKKRKSQSRKLSTESQTKGVSLRDRELVARATDKAGEDR